MHKFRRVLYLLLLIPVLTATGCYSTPEGGQIMVIRNGGPFDNHNIRQVVCPGANRTGTGIASTEHAYPASNQQRIYKLDNTKDADAPPITVRTKDGVNAQISGTIYLSTSFDCSVEGKKLVQEFDNQFGTRGFGAEGLHPWENFGVFLNSVVQPVIDSNFREVIAGVECKELVSSCALVQRGGEQISAKEVAGADNKSNVQKVQDAVNAGLKTQLNADLGQNFFKADSIKFNLQSVELPEVDHAIAQAQSAFAEVSKQQAEVLKGEVRVKQAKQERLANQERQKGYNACHVCGDIDKLKALPQNLQVLGGNAATVLK